jgi:hypothetical protein
LLDFQTWHQGEVGLPTRRHRNRAIRSIPPFA